jgi:hypothetical protein
MDQNKVQAFVMANSGKFDQYQLQNVIDRLKELPDDRYLLLAGMELRDPTMMLLISVFVGHFGVDRMLIGQTGLGIAKLLTCGGLGIWTFVDWFLIMNETRRYNFNMFMLAAAQGSSPSQMQSY